ncbi:MAG TPA: hypothetical protein VHT93_22170 [Pseudolabrys sp.]|jgi:hypothetical protein|nr:hypothetical protein [Pseudolabrys sp.]
MVDGDAIQRANSQQGAVFKTFADLRDGVVVSLAPDIGEMLREGKENPALAGLRIPSAPMLPLFDLDVRG